MKIVDSHCHMLLIKSKIGKSDEEIILDASKANVCFLHNICTNLEEFESIIAPAKIYQNVKCSIGCHPCDACKLSFRMRATTVQDLENAFAGNEKYVISVGETGLDYYHPHTEEDKELQKKSFFNHALFANKYNLPLVIHLRDKDESAEEDFCDLLQNDLQGLHLKGIMHCFGGSSKFMHKMIEYGFYISLSGIVTFKNAKNLQEIAKQIPLERLLIETDAPYLAPIPMRGKLNEPAFLFHTANFLSNLYKISLEELAQQTTTNFERLFDISV